MRNKKTFKESFGSISLLERLTYKISLSVLGVAILILFLFLYWYLVPQNIITIKNNPVPVEKKQISAKDVQVLDINYCKYQEMRGVVLWSLVSNRQVIVLPSYTDLTPVGCGNDLRIPILLPPIKFSDMYHFHYVIIYQINPVKTETVIFDSQAFKIMGLDGN